MRASSSAGRRAARGQTLIESSILASVLAIAMTLGLPALGDALARQSITAAAATWRDAQAIARSHAILRRTPVAICPSLDGSTCTSSVSWQDGFIAFEDPDRNRTRGPHELLVRVFPPSSRLELRSSAGRRVIVFQPSGRPDGSNVTMTICDPRRPALDGVRLVTSNSGRTRREAVRCDVAGPAGDS
jgi:type IV fimbrial biogenesis protein FimT